MIKRTASVSLTIIALATMSLPAGAAKSLGSGKWSMRYLARSSNFLLVANDSALSKQPLICPMKKSEPPKLSLKLKMIVDEKIKTLSSTQKEQVYEAAKTCELDCSCDIYSLALEKDSDPRAGKLLELVNAKGKNIQMTDRLACAKKFREFCNGSLLPALRR